MKAQSAKAKGSRLERQAAQILGGKRAPLSGAIGGGDLWLPSESIFADWVYEAKSRARLPAYFTLAMQQAALEAKVSNKRPAVILREDRGRVMIACYLQDFVEWSQALADVGNGARIKTLVRQAKDILEEVRSSL